MNFKQRFYLILTILLILQIIPLFKVSASPLQIGDKINIRQVNQWQFTNDIGMRFDEEATHVENYYITGVNSTFVNYTYHIYSDIYGIYDPQPYAGSWTFRRVSGKYEYTYNYQFNRTIDSRYPYFHLSWFEQPTWDNETCGENYQGWNESSHDIYGFFDKYEESHLDSFDIFLSIPFFVKQPKAYISQIETQWHAYTQSNASKLPIIFWNRTKQTWNDIRYQLFFRNVAYSLEVISEELYKFTPEWFGYSWYPNEFSRWDGQSWVPNADPDTNYATTYDPSSYSETYTFFARQRLNFRHSSFLDYCKILKEEFTDNSITLDFEIDITDYERFTYHSSSGSWYDNPNRGTLRLIYKIKFHKDKGYYQSGEISEEYDFGTNGKYYVSITRQPASSGNITGFEAIFLLIVVPILIVSKKKRKDWEN